MCAGNGSSGILIRMVGLGAPGYTDGCAAPTARIAKLFQACGSPAGLIAGPAALAVTGACRLLCAARGHLLPPRWESLARWPRRRCSNCCRAGRAEPGGARLLGGALASSGLQSHPYPGTGNGRMARFREITRMLAFRRAIPGGPFIRSCRDPGCVIPRGRLASEGARKMSNRTSKYRSARFLPSACIQCGGRWGKQAALSRRDDRAGVCEDGYSLFQRKGREGAEAPWR